MSLTACSGIAAGGSGGGVVLWVLGRTVSLGLCLPWMKFMVARTHTACVWVYGSDQSRDVTELAAALVVALSLVVCSSSAAPRGLRDEPLEKDGVPVAAFSKWRNRRCWNMRVLPGRKGGLWPAGCCVPLSVDVPPLPDLSSSKETR